MSSSRNSSPPPRTRTARNTPANAPEPTDRSALRPALFSLLQRLCHQLVPKPCAARIRGNNHPADHHVAILRLRVEQPQIRHQPILIPCHQMAGVTFQILTIDVLIHAFLFDDEHLCAQAAKWRTAVPYPGRCGVCRSSQLSFSCFLEHRRSDTKRPEDGCLDGRKICDKGQNAIIHFGRRCLLCVTCNDALCCGFNERC